MQFIGALALLFASASANPFAPKANRKSAYVNKLISGAKVTRRLDQEDYEVNISAYSVKFEQCQFVKAYNDELAEGGESTTVLATQRFVLFRLCPDDCSSCNSNYGEYLVDLDTYLQATVEYFQDYQEEMCEACEETCYNQANEEEQQDGGRRRRNLQNYNVDCSTCLEECQKIENMEENGYVDASDFLECAMIYDPEDDNKAALYAGPICANGGSKIKIGVFTDEYCNSLDSSKEVDDYLLDGDGYAIKLSHALLKSTYTNTCISCKEPAEQDENEEEDNQDQNNDNQDADEVIEMCEDLYEAAAKCESSTGFANGYVNYNNYANQINQEETVCEFMQSLKSGTYDEEGEIIVAGANSMRSGGKSATGGQKFALTFFILGTVGLAVYAAMLHSKLVKGGGKADLSSAGGAMA